MTILNEVSDPILGRPAHEMRLAQALTNLEGKSALITGAAGSIGCALAPLLDLYCAEVISTDTNTLDVTDQHAVAVSFSSYRPDAIFHLAGAKHAPAGEEDPWTALQVNAVGTRNVLTAAPSGSRVVTASTCKACNPETAYGASKLLAERLTLNAGHSVARFYNVVETQGNVFDIWRQIPSEDPISYTDCNRYFISIQEALALILWSAVLPAGRYTLDPGERRWMGDVALRAYPKRQLREIPRRRGDRTDEPKYGEHETTVPVEVDSWCGPLRWVSSPHD